MSTNTLDSWCSLKKKHKKIRRLRLLRWVRVHSWILSGWFQDLIVFPEPTVWALGQIYARIFFLSLFFFLKKEIIHLPPTLFSLPSVPVCPISTHCTLSVGGSHNPRGLGDPGNRSQPVWTSGSWQRPRKQERSMLNAFPVGAVNHVILRWMEFSCSFK